MMIIDLNDYRIFPVELKEVFSKDIFDLIDFLCALKSDVRLSSVINKSKDHYTMDFEFDCLAETQCARCLKSIDLPIKKKDKVYLFDKSFEQLSTETIDIQEDELDHYYIKDMVFNLTNFVYEQIIISLPTKAVCYIDCKGLCSFCGTDLNKEECSCVKNNADPRWGKLKNKIKGTGNN